MLFRGAELPAELKSADVEIVSTSETAGRRLVTVKCPTDKLMERYGKIAVALDGLLAARREDRR